MENKEIVNLTKKLNKVKLQLRLNQKEIAKIVAGIFAIADANKIKHKEVYKYLESEAKMTQQQVSKYLKVGKINLNLLDTMLIEEAYASLTGRKMQNKLVEIDKIKRIITTLFNKVEKNNLTNKEKIELVGKIKEILSLLTKEAKKA